jgi:hypothetical protein
MQNALLGRCLATWREGAREQGALWRKAAKVVARLQHAAAATAFVFWGLHAFQGRMVLQKSRQAFLRMRHQVIDCFFSCWARFSCLCFRLELASRQRVFQYLKVCFSTWSSKATLCRALSSRASLSQANSVVFSAEQLATESVALAEFIASLSEATILFHSYQLRKAYAEAESAKVHLLDAAKIFAGRPRLRALAMRVLIEWSSVCSVQKARSEAWAVCAATNARSVMSEAGRVRALSAWAAGTQRFALARLLAAWVAWARTRSGRRRVGSAAKRRRVLRMLARALFRFGRAALLAHAPSLLTA